MQLQALLRLGEPIAVDRNMVFVRFRHEYHTKRVSEESNKRVLEESLEQLLGHSVQVHCLMPDESVPPILSLDQRLPPISTNCETVT